MKKRISNFQFPISNFYQKQLGFTLMELLIVMAILGLLATIGLASFRTSQMKGRDAQRKSDLSQIQKALEMYLNDYGQYPDSLPEGGGSWQDEKGTLYMKEVPKDPKNFDYCYETNGVWYRLYAKLENSKDPSIEKSGCSNGCTCGGDSTYNYKVSSSNAP